MLTINGNFTTNEKNQRTFLFPMKGFKRLVLGMIVIAMIFTLLTYLVPNPDKITIPNSVELINDIRIVAFLSFCVWMLLRIEYIFRTKKPWKYGLEYSIYFHLVPCLIAISTIFFVWIASITLLDNNYLFLYCSRATSIMVALSCAFYFVFKKDKMKIKGFFITPTVGFILNIYAGIVVGMMLNDLWGNVLHEGLRGGALVGVFVASMALPNIFIGALPVVICNLYAWITGKDINLDERYKNADNIDPNKNYPPNFGLKKKKKK
ncbi:hypothetical protein HRK21_07405 [Listeria monocytogenes]|nr:hypothetical protein HRK21_07405 [Listeria monocytogenes]